MRRPTCGSRGGCDDEGVADQRPTVTADQAADLLGVRLQTIYAYVSRGLLQRSFHRDGAGHRVSGFDRDEVLRLVAERTRRSHRGVGSLDVFVETDVTMLDPKGLLAFRGVPVDDLLGHRFEDVAELLWSGDEVLPAGTAWELPEDDARVARRAAEALPAAATDVDRVRVAVVALAAVDPDRADLGREHVAQVGRRAIQAGVEVIPLRQNAVGDAPLEARLWPRLTTRAPDAAGLEALRAALVLLVDHELAASTMAVRVAAGTGADPWLQLLTGLGALGGALHGRSSIGVEALLAARRRGGPDTLTPDAAQPPPGFGHKVYVDADPRAEQLLDRVARLDPDGWPVVEQLLLEVSRRHGLSPNVDLALAALVHACGFAPGSGETVFALARTVGWLAHGLEESPRGLRFRGRAVYTGLDRQGAQGGLDVVERDVAALGQRSRGVSGAGHGARFS